MKIVIVFCVIAYCSKLDASATSPQGTLPQAAQPVTKANHVAPPPAVPPNTVQNVAPKLQNIESNVNLPIEPAPSIIKQNQKSVLHATGVQSQSPIQPAHSPAIHNENPQNIQLLNKLNTVKSMTESTVVLNPRKIVQNTAVTKQVPQENKKVLQAETPKRIQAIHKPAEPTGTVSSPIIEAKKQVITPPVPNVHVQKLNVPKEQESKLIHPVITEKSNNVLATVSTLSTPHIQPIIIGQNNLNKKQESTATHSPKVEKPVENVFIKKIVHPDVIPAATHRLVSKITPEQTVLKINNDDPASSVQAANYAARAAVKAANEAFYSSASASKAAHEANVAALSAKHAVKSIEITAAELASRSKALKVSPTEDISDDTLTFSEKDAGKIADIVVAAINRALQSIKIPNPKGLSKASKVIEIIESQDNNETNCNDKLEKTMTTSHVLVPKKSNLIPSHAFSSESKPSDKNTKLSSLKLPKKLAFMSSPIFYHTPESDDTAFKSCNHENEDDEDEDENTEDELEECDDDA